MIIRFSVENFRSFKEKNTLTFQAGTIKEFLRNVYMSPLQPDFKILKSCGLFGANSTGKSNLIKALAFCQKIIAGNTETATVNFSKSYYYRLQEGFEEKPSNFEFVFLVGDARYKYGFSIQKGKIISEYLFSVMKTKEEVVFLRSGNGFSHGKKIRQELRHKLELFNEMTRTDTLFISVLAKFNYATAIEITGWFDNIIFYDDLNLLDFIDMTGSLMGKDEYYFHRVQGFISQLDLGIKSIEPRVKEAGKKNHYTEEFLNFFYKSTAKVYNISTIHNKYSTENLLIGKIRFDLLEDESIGTQKIFALLGPILYALKNRSIIIIDEIDSKIHTGVLQSLIDAFHNDVLNIVGSQLIFSSHNPLPLKMNLRRDQMVFFEKDEFGASSFKSLYEKQPNVRNDASFDKDYLQGRYSRIPKLGNQLDLFSDL